MLALVDTRVKYTVTYGSPQKFSGPISTINGTVMFWGVVWLGKMHFVPEAPIDNMQAYPTPKNVKEVQAFVGIWGG